MVAPGAYTSAQTDTSRKPATANAAADSAAPSGNSWGFGVAAGQLRFPGNARELAMSASVATHLWHWVDLSVNPTYASATAADTVINGRTVTGRTASGMAALPVSVGISHDLAGPWSPSFSLGVGFSLPMGDTASVGSSQAGYGANLAFGVSPSDRFSMSLGALHALNDAYASGIGNSSPTELSASSTLRWGSVGVSASYSGDVGSAADGYSSSQTVGGGVSIPLRGDFSLTIDGASGLTAGAPSWSMSVGVGTTPAGVASVMLSPFARARRAFGAGRKLTKIKPKTRPATKTPAKG